MILYAINGTVTVNNSLVLGIFLAVIYKNNLQYILCWNYYTFICYFLRWFEFIEKCNKIMANNYYLIVISYFYFSDLPIEDIFQNWKWRNINSNIINLNILKNYKKKYAKLKYIK